jgi:hypothetical protein
MIGEWPFELAVFPGAPASDLLAAWERFALPLIAAVVPEDRGASGFPRSGALLEVKGAQLSSIRRADDAELEIRVWNPDRTAGEAVVGGERFSLRPCEIRTVTLATGSRPAPG